MTVTSITDVTFGVLGPVTATRSGRNVALGGTKQQSCLALLIAAGGRGMTRDAIIDAIWGSVDPASHVASFHTYVSNLRSLLGDVIQRTGDTYRLVAPESSIDSQVFERAVNDAPAMLAVDPIGCSDRLQEALALWRGHAYGDLDDIGPLVDEARRLGEVRLAAVELRLDADLVAGRHDRLVAEIEALAEEHPTRERFRAQHMLALYRSGRQADALRSFRRAEEYLGEELGLEPGRELRDLELAILRHDESLLDGSGRVTTERMAFLVADIENSTSAWERNHHAMAEALALHDRVLADAVSSAGGRIFKHTGDGVLAVFTDAAAAARAAEAAQRALAATDWGEIGELRIRMAIDVGDVESRSGDFYGPPINRAARLCAAGHGGQVLIASAAQDELTDSGLPGVQIRHLGRVRLRGVTAAERVAQLVFVGLPGSFPDLRTDDPPTDSLLALPGYEVRDQIGEGAFSVVYRAFQPSVGREVAVKVIRPDLSQHPTFVRRFEAEARTIAHLAHPHIVPLIDFWRDAAGAYLVLRLMSGGTVAEAISAGGLDRATARRMLRQIGEALDHAHSRGIVHGDIQPQNVLIDDEGNAYLSDFGIVGRLISPELAPPSSAGTDHTAPEVDVTGPTPAADRFALGTVAACMLGDASEIRAVIARMTAHRPDDRHPSCLAFTTELDGALGEDVTAPKTVEVSRNPYKGLRAFDEGDAIDFHGRADLVDTLVAAVAAHRFVTVVGPSGSGKSSAVRAGLLPALRKGAVGGSESWFHTICTPGPAPIESLLRAVGAVVPTQEDVTDLVLAGDLAGATEVLLRDVDGELLVVIDQFEEIYTLIDDLDRRSALVESLCDAVTRKGSRVRFVVTLRADFYHRPLEHDGLGRLVRDGLVTVLQPSPEELTQMVVGPALPVGIRFEPSLTHRIVSDVARQVGGLPLLQYCLTELVERRRGSLLTFDDYERIGTVSGAVAARAEAVWSDLTPATREATRQIMLRLVTVDETAHDVRRRVRRSELQSLGIDRSDLDGALDALTVERLVSADSDPVTHGPTVEVAHEALLRTWPRLTKWIDEQRESLMLGRRFRAAMADWEAAGRDDGYLLTGSRLAPYIEWALEGALTSDECAYFDSSVARDRFERESVRRRRRTLFSVVSAAAVVATLLAILAFVQAQRADDEARTARGRELSASALVALSEDPSLARLLAIEAIDVAEPTIDNLATLHRILAADVVVHRYSWPEGMAVDAVSADLHPDGHHIAVGGGVQYRASMVEMHDLDRDETVWRWELPDTGGDSGIGVGAPFFSSDGEVVYVGVEAGADADIASVPAETLGVHVLDAATGEHLDRLDVTPCGARILDISASHLAVTSLIDSSSGDQGAPVCGRQTADLPRVEVRLIELADGSDRLLSSDGFPGQDTGVALSGDGTRVAYDDQAGGTWMTYVEEVDTGKRVFSKEWSIDLQEEQGVWDLSQDGALLATGARPIIVWSVDDGSVATTLAGDDLPEDVGFGSEGSALLVATRDSRLRILDAETGDVVSEHPGLAAGRVAPRADLVAVSGRGSSEILVVDTGFDGEGGRVEIGGTRAVPLSLSIAGGVGIASSMRTDDLWDTHIFDTRTFEIRHTLEHQGTQGIVLSPDGERLMRQEETVDDTAPLGFLTGLPTVWDTRSGEPTLVLGGGCTWDIGLVIQNGADPTNTGDCPDGGRPYMVMDAVWSNDGSMVAGSQFQRLGGDVIVWDARDGSLLHVQESPSRQQLGGLFSPDGAELFVAEFGVGITRLSTETWQEIGRIPTDVFPAGFTDGGRTLVGLDNFLGGGPAAIVWIDVDTGAVTHQVDGVAEGSATSFDTYDGELLAVGSADGELTVWDLSTHELLHRASVAEDEIDGLAFIDRGRVLVHPEHRDPSVVIIDVASLVTFARQGVTRGFSDTECEEYGFDECPTLAEFQLRD